VNRESCFVKKRGFSKGPIEHTLLRIPFTHLGGQKKGDGKSDVWSSKKKGEEDYSSLFSSVFHLTKKNPPNQALEPCGRQKQLTQPPPKATWAVAGQGKNQNLYLFSLSTGRGELLKLCERIISPGAVSPLRIDELLLRASAD